ncbi:exodeoxyribonuclease VII large subunit [Leucothrix arctica]|uniref:exodeoxyribonuclease VII large subunit n=1 Tax=Leucothrix arctica TaxID=1481894 RepID=UPI0024821C9D|nr:exodeoxyribonuclease VII large subunit [Leucothrix arctica]
MSELNAEVALMLSQSFGLVWLEGEISNFARPASGHFYFSLKDKKAQVRCAMFRNKNLALKLKPENGMQVMVRARIGLYEPRGEFQVIIEHMEEAGAGLLQRQFEELKASLAAQGLFDTEHKKPLPKLPTAIGVITSPTGAAIRDILQVLERRAPQIPVYIYPVAVQGKKAAKEIESAILRANKDKKCDLLIIGRGGGSLEDLWSFNERNVATAIFDSVIPVISAVGHEVDTTIADYVADVRAATPSVAAELAVPDMQELRIKATNLDRRLSMAMQRFLQQRHQTLQLRLQQLSNQRPAYRLQQQKQRLDELTARADRAIHRILEKRAASLSQLETKLQANAPKHLLAKQAQRAAQLDSRLHQTMQQIIERRQSKFAVLASRLNSVSPLNTLQRGYSITQDAKTGSVIQSVKGVMKGQDITIRLADGSIEAQAK